jgi:protein-tyrosine phosphatase|tara:strand:+ start:13573 stop:14022 length:450 start_codon:yes stop_codon:yes gene_type:complete
MKILMVCLGNICRSPLAEGILKSKSTSIIIDSAGIAGYHIGKPPDIRSIEIANKFNIDLTNQRARQFSNNDFNDFDKIYAMDNDNYSKIISLAKNQAEINKVDLILNETYPEEFKSVPDPYYGGEQGFEDIFHLLDKACDIIANKYEKR